MYANSGYLYDVDVDILDDQHQIIVSSCGQYRLISCPEMYTIRPEGRKDYQLLYVISGKAYFFKDGKKLEVTAGNLVLYRPGQPQKYYYTAEDRPHVYWVHFSGYDVENYLSTIHMSTDEIRYIDITSEYIELFDKMIQELQIKRPEFVEMVNLYMRQFFTYIIRQESSEKIGTQRGRMEMEKAILYFNENYNNDICINSYARENNMSTCWFVRSFRKYTGVPPMQYITSVRINKAKELLYSTDLNIGEIGQIVGYQNQLYFSRIFKKHFGISPSNYRKKYRTSD